MVERVGSNKMTKSEYSSDELNNSLSKSTKKKNESTDCSSKVRTNYTFM